MDSIKVVDTVQALQNDDPKFKSEIASKWKSELEASEVTKY